MAKETGVIYCIENTVNGKKYVGQTINLNRRFQEHVRYSRTPIEKAIDKYGKRKFKIKILENNVDAYKLNRMEKKWIDKLNTFRGRGYNCTPGGEGYCGKDHPLFGKKIKDVHSDGCNCPVCGDVSGSNNPMYGKKHSQNTKNKIRESIKGRKHSLETKLKMSQQRKGRKHKEETKKKIKESLTGRKHLAGDKNPNSKGSEKTSIKILHDYHIKNLSQQETADKRGYSQSVISEIINCNHWTTKELSRN